MDYIENPCIQKSRSAEVPPHINTLFATKYWFKLNTTK